MVLKRSSSYSGSTSENSSSVSYKIVMAQPLKSASPFRDDQAEKVYLKANVNYNLKGDEEPGCTR